jgi:phosphoglycerate dehydrogenase-like enzyme
MKNIFNIYNNPLIKIAEGKPRTLIVTIAGMIDKKDLGPLKAVSQVDYHEVKSISEDALAKKCEGYDYLMVNMDVLPLKGKVKMTDGFYSNDSVKKLKMISVDMTGLDYFSPDAAAKNEVKLKGISDYSTESVAESVLAEVFLHSRQRHMAYMDIVKGRKQEARKGINLLNKTAGIIGYGNIGSRVGDLLKGIGMNVMAWDPFPKAGLEVHSMKKIFDKADVVCVLAKTILEGKDSNVDLVDYELMKRSKGAILVNLANPSLVNRGDLYRAMESGAISAYSYQKESGSDKKDKIESLSGVHVCPPNAWDSDESREDLKKEWMNNVIDSIKDGVERTRN